MLHLVTKDGRHDFTPHLFTQPNDGISGPGGYFIYELDGVTGARYKVGTVVESRIFDKDTR